MIIANDALSLASSCSSTYPMARCSATFKPHRKYDSDSVEKRSESRRANKKIESIFAKTRKTLISTLAEGKEMTTAQKVYTGIVIAFAALLSLGFAQLYFTVLSKPDDSGTPHYQLFQFVVFAFAFIAAFLFATSGVNLAKGKLLVVSTVPQVAMLIFSVYGIPIGIWGICLLCRECKRSKDCQQELGQVSSETAVSDELSS